MTTFQNRARRWGWGLALLLAACSSGSPVATNRFAYPTDHRLRVQEVCSLLYTPRYARYVAPSLDSRVREISPRGASLVAKFADGRRYEIPLDSGLPTRTYYCAFESNPTPCASRYQDWDRRCETKSLPQVDRYNY